MEYVREKLVIVLVLFLLSIYFHQAYFQFHLLVVDQRRFSLLLGGEQSSEKGESISILHSTANAKKWTKQRWPIFWGNRIALSKSVDQVLRCQTWVSEVFPPSETNTAQKKIQHLNGHFRVHFRCEKKIGVYAIAVGRGRSCMLETNRMLNGFLSCWCCLLYLACWLGWPWAFLTFQTLYLLHVLTECSRLMKILVFLINMAEAPLFHEIFLLEWVYLRNELFRWSRRWEKFGI